MDWPFVGRTAQLDSVVRGLRGGDPTGVLLVGPAGIGKTRLAREAAATWRRRGGTVVWLAASEALHGRSFGVFTGSLRPGGGDVLAVMDRLLTALRTAGPRPVVVVDDAPRVDDATAVLVARLVREPAIRVLLTARSGESLPLPLDAVAREGALRRLDIAALGETEFRRFVETALRAGVETEGLTRLHRVSGGNPLYARLTIEGDHEAGRLVMDHGRWRWRAPSRLSPALADVLGRRLTETLGADDDLRDAADVVALAEPVELGLLTAVAASWSAERLEDLGILQVETTDGTTWCRTAHPLFGELLRTRMGSLRSRRLSGALVEAVRSHSLPMDPDRLVGMTLDAGLPVDPALAQQAAAAALQHLDLARAVRFAEAAIAAGAGLEARLDLAFALSWSNLGEAAAATADALFGAVSSVRERALAAQVLAGNAYFVLGEPETALGLLDTQGDLVAADAQASREIDAMRAWFETFQARPDRGIELAAAASSGPSLSPVGATAVTTAETFAHAMRGDADLADLSSGPGLGVPTAFTSIQFAVLEGQLCAVNLSGELTSAPQVLGLIPAGIDGDLSFYGDMSRALRGCAQVQCGEVTAGATTLHGVVMSLHEYDRTGWAYLASLHLTQALALAGRAAEARSSWQQCVRLRHPGFLHREPERLVTEAWVVAAEGQLAQATDLARDAAGLAARTGMHAAEALCLHAAVRLGDPAVEERLTELATATAGPRAALAARHAGALAARDPAALRAVSLELERHRDLGAALDAEVHALTILRADGRAGAALTSESRISAIASTTGLHTPALATRSFAALLSRREYEVVALAARGLANREIAARLVLSVRTVEGHLYRAGQKLGVSHRGELADLLGTAGDPNA